jgi:tetratricopeptide (TPR) repeat protein
MRLLTSLLLFTSLSIVSMAQDPATLMEEGRKLEQKLKDEEAIEKYKQAIIIQPSNQAAINRCAELTLSIGGRTTDEVQRAYHFAQAKKFAEAALKLDSNNAESNFLMSVVYSRLTEAEKSKEAVANYLKQSKAFADRAVQSDPAYGKGYYAQGKWHMDVLGLTGVKKTTIKLLYGGLPEANVEQAISLMEKCKSLEPYYCANFLDLAKAYHFHKKYEKAIATLEQLAKLPTRRQDDVRIKAEGAELLQKLQ